MLSLNSTTRRRELYPWQAAAVPPFNPFIHLAFVGGIGTGKTYTGAQFAIYHIENYSHLTGFIGANTYDQLSQVTLMELFYWLDDSGFEYVIDKRPPPEWGYRKNLKDYNNVLSVRYKGRVVTIFTRVLTDGNPLRGLEFSWYWIDETRDTPKDTHNIILARMRESEYMKGLITTTANGEDWVWALFVNAPRAGFGALHVATRMAIDCGLHTEEFYAQMLAAYDTRTARQELNAEHVSVAGLPAYHANGEHNHMRASPFTNDGSLVSPFLPVTIGLDFNVTPMSWHLGQFRGPKSYWFDEIHIENTNTAECAEELVQRLLALKSEGVLRATPNVRLCGDATGESRHTSATQTDYDIICMALDRAGITWSNDTPESNPPVKTRVMTVNSRLQTASGAVTMWYHPERCPKFKRDLEQVVWKEGAEFTLETKKDASLTHASDSIGYPVCVYAPIEIDSGTGLVVIRPR